MSVCVHIFIIASCISFSPSPVSCVCVAAKTRLWICRDSIGVRRYIYIRGPFPIPTIVSPTLPPPPSKQRARKNYFSLLVLLLALSAGIRRISKAKRVKVQRVQCNGSGSNTLRLIALGIVHHSLSICLCCASPLYLG